MKTREEIIAQRGYPPNILGTTADLETSSYHSSAAYLAKRLANPNRTLTELCCGIGIFLLEAAPQFAHVTGIDSDPSALDSCAKNLAALGLADRATLLLRNIQTPRALDELTLDIAVYDIPFWNTRDEHKNPPFGYFLKRLLQKTPDVAVTLPPKYTAHFLHTCFSPCEVERVLINGKHDRNHAYFGTLRRGTDTEISLETS